MLTQALLKHTAEMQKEFHKIPQWMSEYAVCPEHWLRLCQETVMMTHRENDERVWSRGGTIYLFGLTLHWRRDCEIVPPLCVFQSLGV